MKKGRLILLMLLIILPIGGKVKALACDPGDGSSSYLEVGKDGEKYCILSTDGTVSTELESSGLTYNKETKTLALNNFTGDYINEFQVDEINVTIEGNNTLSGSFTMEGEHPTSYTMSFNGTHAIFDGNGTLNLSNSSSYDGENLRAIAAIKITFNGATININGNSYTNGIEAIYLTIDGGNINITGNKITVGLAGSDIILKSGNVYIKGANEVTDTIYGIVAQSDIEILGGNLTIDGNSSMFGLSPSAGMVKISDGKVVINDCSIGIAYSGLKMTDGYLEINNSYKSAIEFRDAENLTIADVIDTSKLKLLQQNLKLSLYDYVEGQAQCRGYAFVNEDGKRTKNLTIAPIGSDEDVVEKEQKVNKTTDLKPIIINKDVNKFIALYVNGVKLTKDVDYTVDGDNEKTVITLNEEFLKKLDDGDYTVNAIFDDGIVEVNFNVSINNPKTLDNKTVILGIGLLALVGIYSFTAALFKKKNVIFEEY